MYDKLGLMLRIETVINQPGEFKVLRACQHRDGSVIDRLVSHVQRRWQFTPLSKPRSGHATNATWKPWRRSTIPRPATTTWRKLTEAAASAGTQLRGLQSGSAGGSPPVRRGAGGRPHRPGISQQGHPRRPVPGVQDQQATTRPQQCCRRPHVETIARARPGGQSAPHSTLARHGKRPTHPRATRCARIAATARKPHNTRSFGFAKLLRKYNTNGDVRA